MATVNYSVPEEVKQRFNATFGDRNKSRIVAALMTRAVEEEERRVRRAVAMAELFARRAERGPISDEAFRAAREKGRP